MPVRSNKLTRELFDAASFDWPSPASAERVIYTPVMYDADATRRCQSVLSCAELQLADCFLTDSGRTEFIQRRAFRRYCGSAATGWQYPLSDIKFCETENGRPYLRDRPELSFSFSSCRLGFVGAWSSTHGVGIDIEDQNTEVEAAELAEFYFTGREARAVENAVPRHRRAFLRLWSLKEAALKSIGEGLPFGLDTFEFDESLRIIAAPDTHGGPGRFSVHMFDNPDVFAALVARTL